MKKANPCLSERKGQRSGRQAHALNRSTRKRIPCLVDDKNCTPKKESESGITISFSLLHYLATAMANLLLSFSANLPFTGTQVYGVRSAHSQPPNMPSFEQSLAVD
jgi:hypothetical protein